MSQTANYVAAIADTLAGLRTLSGTSGAAAKPAAELVQYLHDTYGIKEHELRDCSATVAGRQWLASKFAASDADADPELARRFAELAMYVAENSTTPTAGVAVREIKADSLTIDEVTATSLSAPDEFEAGVAATGVAGQVDGEQAVTSPPTPAVVGVQLTNVEAGGGIHIGSIATSLTQIFVGQPEDKRTAQQRADMLELVEDTWIRGVLTPSLRTGTALYLHLSPRPDLVDNRPFDDLVQMPDAPAVSIDPLDDIVDVFRRSHQRLLLAGEPGCGKTTLLLILAQAAIAAARAEGELPIPVVFNLASWSTRYDSLQTWIASELKDKYMVPSKTASAWLADDVLLLLLDGLDEVNAGEREECVKAINAFLSEHHVGMAVCSRLTEYSELHVRLRLRAGARIEQLTTEQIEDYAKIAAAGRPELAKLIVSDEGLRELASTPLMLNVMTVAAGQLSQDGSALAASSQADLQNQLFSTYMASMFRRRSPRQLYTEQQTTEWLEWLARRMVVQGQSIFLLDQIQPALLRNRGERALHHGLVRLLAFLLIVVFCGAAGALAGQVNTRTGWLVGSSAGLVLGAVLAAATVLSSMLALWLPELLAIPMTFAACTLGLKLVFSRTWPEALLAALVVCLPGILAGPFLAGRRDIRPVWPLSWSWRWAGPRILLGLAAAVVLGAVIAVVTDLESGAGYGLMIGVFCLLPIVLFEMNTSAAIMPAITPNQAIRNSLWTALAMFGLTAIVGVLVAVAWELTKGKVVTVGLAFGFSLALPVGLMVALAAGGATVAQHYVLRAMLSVTGRTPWRFRRFLEYAAERVFLRRTGSGYIFYHRLFMEYLAQRKEENDAIK